MTSAGQQVTLTATLTNAARTALVDARGSVDASAALSSISWNSVNVTSASDPVHTAK